MESMSNSVPVEKAVTSALKRYHTALFEFTNGVNMCGTLKLPAL